MVATGAPASMPHRQFSIAIVGGTVASHGSREFSEVSRAGAHSKPAALWKKNPPSPVCRPRRVIGRAPRRGLPPRRALCRPTCVHADAAEGQEPGFSKLNFGDLRPYCGDPLHLFDQTTGAAGTTEGSAMAPAPDRVPLPTRSAMWASCFSVACRRSWRLRARSAASAGLRQAISRSPG